MSIAIDYKELGRSLQVLIFCGTSKLIWHFTCACNLIYTITWHRFHQKCASSQRRVNVTPDYIFTHETIHTRIFMFVTTQVYSRLRFRFRTVLGCNVGSYRAGSIIALIRIPLEELDDGVVNALQQFMTEAVENGVLASGDNTSTLNVDSSSINSKCFKAFILKRDIVS